MQGLPVHSVVGDVRDRKQMREIVQSTETLGGLDIMVANAGAASCVPVSACSACLVEITPKLDGATRLFPFEDAPLLGSRQLLSRTQA